MKEDDVMPSLYPYRIFVSHAWKYGQAYDSLIALLDAASNFSYRNYSAPQEKPLQLSSPYATKQEIQSAITQKIAPAQGMLVLSGMYGAYREWMQYEVAEASRMGKPIIAIRPRSQERVPDFITASAKATVGWNTNSIVQAVRTYF